MNDQPNTYLGVNLERWKLNMVEHLRNERRRNALLQQALDDSNARVAKLQAELMDAQSAPKPPLPDRQLSLLTKSRAVRRLLEARMGIAV